MYVIWPPIIRFQSHENFQAKKLYEGLDLFQAKKNYTLVAICWDLEHAMFQKTEGKLPIV